MKRAKGDEKGEGDKGNGGIRAMDKGMDKGNGGPRQQYIRTAMDKGSGGPTIGNIMHMARLATSWWSTLAYYELGPKLVCGGLSHIAEALLVECEKMLDSVCILGPSGQRLMMFIRFGCFVSDESAAQHIFRFKDHFVFKKRTKARRWSRN